jgi:hypothetical protein
MCNIIETGMGTVKLGHTFIQIESPVNLNLEFLSVHEVRHAKHTFISSMLLSLD